MNTSFNFSDHPLYLSLFVTFSVTIILCLIVTAHDLAGAVRLSWLDSSPLLKWLRGPVCSKRGIYAMRMVLVGTFYVAIPALALSVVYSVGSDRSIDRLTLWCSGGIAGIALLMLVTRPVRQVHGYIQYLERCVQQNHPHVFDGCEGDECETIVKGARAGQYMKVLKASPASAIAAATSAAIATGSSLHKIIQ